MRTDLLTTGASSVVVMISGLYIFRLASTLFDPTGFGAYSVSRRVLGLMVPVVMLGLGVVLPRSISLHHQAADTGKPIRFVWAALIAVLPAYCIIVAAATVAPTKAASLLFGDAAYRTLLPPIGLTVFGLCIQAVCYGYFRGCLRIRAANMLVTVVMAICPIGGFMLGATSVGGVLWLTGVLTTSVSAVVLGTILLQHRDAVSISWRAAVALLREGLPRVPGDLALAALLSFPSIVAAQSASLQEAGVVAFGTTIVTMAGAAFAPISMVVLPHTARRVGLGQVDAVRAQAWRLIRVVAPMTALGVVVFELLSPSLIAWYLGDEYAGSTGALQLMALAAVPYAVFVSIRSIVDALSERPLNAVSCMAALATYLLMNTALSAVAEPVYANIGACVIAIWLLAGMTMFFAARGGAIRTPLFAPELS